MKTILACAVLMVAALLSGCRATVEVPSGDGKTFRASVGKTPEGKLTGAASVQTEGKGVIEVQF